MALPAQLQGAFLPTFGLFPQVATPSYAAGITEDMLKDPTQPAGQSAMGKEQFFNQVFKPSIGGDAGLLSFFPSGGRGQGQVDGSPRVPDFNQFLKGESTYSHRHDGKVYGMKATRDTSQAFNKAYDAYVASINSQNQSAQKAYETELGFVNAIRGIRDQAGVQKLDTEVLRSGLANLTAQRNFAASAMANRLNFQVSDQQIIDDLNSTRLARLNSIVERGNAQVVGIQERIANAQRLVQGLPQSDQRRRVADDAIASMQADLASVNSAITEATEKIRTFRPVTAADEEGVKEINNFREFIKLPEERSLDQIRQIDPAGFSAAQSLTNRYMDFAGQPIGDTTDARTEALRGSLEDEALNQLALGSQLDSDSLRQYQQASRAAQTARGNIFGVAPAVEEAVQTGAAGEQRRLARFGAASNFLASGQTRSDALRENLAFRDTLLSNRLGQASNFLASGPSLYNLANARTNQQQNAFQNYINANQVNPGQFNPTTIQNPFYQTTNPQIPVALTQTAANIYGSLADYQSRTYGAYAGAQAQVAAANSVPNYISAFTGLVPSFSF